MRAQRFALEMPVRYRPVGEMEWLEGTTQNISYSGLLFRAGRALDIDTPVEISITLPVSTASQLTCQARIVRAETYLAEPPVALAAAFSEYQLVPFLNQA